MAVASIRETARQNESSATHVARVRHAMSELFMRFQEQWIEIALDETQEPVSMQTTAATAQVMVLHMKFFRLSAKGAKLHVFRVVLPTVVLQGTTTADILGGLLARLPIAPAWATPSLAP